MQPLKHHDEPRRKISAPAYRPGRRDSVVAVHTNRRASVAAPRRFNRRGSEVSILLDNLQDSNKTVLTFNTFIGTCSNNLLTQTRFTLLAIHSVSFITTSNFRTFLHFSRSEAESVPKMFLNVHGILYTTWWLWWCRSYFRTVTYKNCWLLEPRCVSCSKKTIVNVIQNMPLI